MNAAPVSTKAFTLAILEGPEGFPISIFTIATLQSEKRERLLSQASINLNQVFYQQMLISLALDEE